MLNKLIQGTAADILKTALLQAWDEGLYDILTLHLLVHDEQVTSLYCAARAVIRLRSLSLDRVF